MDSLYRLKDTWIYLADIKTFSLTPTGSNETELKSICITLREGDPIKIDFADRTVAERYCKELDKVWTEYLLTLPRPVLRLDEDKLAEYAEMARPGMSRFHEIFCFDDEIEFSLNPFTQFLLDNIYERKLIDEKSVVDMKFYFEDGLQDIEADPAMVLNFDFSLCPDQLYMVLPQQEARLDGYFNCFCLKRKGDNLYFEFQVNSHYTKDTSILNPKLLMRKMMAESVTSALTCYDEFDYLGEDDAHTSFYYTHIGGGNMYKAYMNAFSILEALYLKALEDMKKEAAMLLT